MSSPFFTRTKYDSCASNRTDLENKRAFTIQTDSNTRKVQRCHASFGRNGGLSGGVPDSIIDVSSDLRGQTRLLTRCPESRHNPLKNCENCDNCNDGIPCGCFHCKQTKELNMCDNALVPEYTRLNKGCNLPGLTINRFDPLCDPIQMEGQSLPIAGSNTRIAVKDQFVKAKQESGMATRGGGTGTAVACNFITSQKRSFCQ